MTEQPEPSALSRNSADRWAERPFAALQPSSDGHIGAINLRLGCFLRQNTKIKRKNEVSLGHVFQQLHRSSAQANTVRCQPSSDTPKRGQYPQMSPGSRCPGAAALADPPHEAGSLLCGFRSAGHGARDRLTSMALEFIRFQLRWRKGCGGPRRIRAALAPHWLCGSDNPAP